MDHERFKGCFGCSGDDHMAGECPHLQEIVRNGMVIQDPVTRRYAISDRRHILHCTGENIADAAQRTHTLSY